MISSTQVTPVLRGYESAVVGRSGLRGKEPQYEPRHGHGACPRAAKARPADAAPPPFSSIASPLPRTCRFQRTRELAPLRPGSLGRVFLPLAATVPIRSVLTAWSSTAGAGSGGVPLEAA